MDGSSIWMINGYDLLIYLDGDGLRWISIDPKMNNGIMGNKWDISMIKISMANLLMVNLLTVIWMVIDQKMVNQYGWQVDIIY